MKGQKARNLIFKPSNLFLIFTIGSALPIQANAVVVLGKDLNIKTVESVGNTRPPVVVGPQVDDPDFPVQIVRKMAAKEKIYFLARGTAKSNTSAIQMLGMQIICRGEGEENKKDPRWLWSTRNHLGKNAYPDGILRLDVRYLFIAPVADTYTCILRAQNFAGVGAEEGVQSWTLLKGTTESNNTYLTADYTVPGSISWGTENDLKDSERVAAGESPKGYSTTHAHIAKTGDLFNAKGYDALTSPKWKPAENNNVRVISDIEMTVCYLDTGSCPTYAQGVLNQSSLGSTVDTRLIVDQFRANSTGPLDVCKRTSTPYVRTTISSATHHQKIYHTNDVAVSNCGADSYFTSRIDIQWVSDNPVRVENSEYSHGAFINVPSP